MGREGVTRLSEVQICWLGLRDDREKQIAIDFFWQGVVTTDYIKRQVNELEAEWRKAKDSTTTV